MVLFSMKFCSFFYFIAFLTIAGKYVEVLVTNSNLLYNITKSLNLLVRKLLFYNAFLL